MFIAIVGTRGSGKSTILQYLVQRGFTPVYLASSSVSQYSRAAAHYPMFYPEDLECRVTEVAYSDGQSSSQCSARKTRVVLGNEFADVPLFHQVSDHSASTCSRLCFQQSTRAIGLRHQELAV